MSMIIRRLTAAVLAGAVTAAVLAGCGAKPAASSSEPPRQTAASEAMQPQKQPEDDKDEKDDKAEPQPTAAPAATAAPEPAVPAAPPKAGDIVEKVEADYEKWLASAAVIGYTMMYTDHTLSEVLLASETPNEDYLNSKGVYLILDDGACYVHCLPLEAERTEPGTVDLYTGDMGYATFDLTEGSAPVGDWDEADMDDLKETIDQSLLVTVMEH